MFKHKKKTKKLIILFFVLFFVLSGVLNFQTETKAQVVVVESVPEKTTNILDKIKSILKKLWDNAGQELFNTVATNTLNRLAYDAADVILSGDSGQKPMFIDKNMGEYFVDIGDAAAGDFLDGLNDLGDMNLCEPNLAIKASIGLGLVDTKRPAEPSCKASDMVKSWEDEFQKFKDMSEMSNKELLGKVVGSFNPTSSDLSVTASLFQGMEEKEASEIKKAEQEQDATDGKFIDSTSPGGQITKVPGTDQRSFENAQKKMTDNVDACDGDNLFACAGNVFINHLALNAFNRALDYSFSPDEQDPLADSDPYDLSDPDSDPSVVYQKDQPTLRRILEPNFNERVDYNILSKLSVCPQANIGGQDFVPAPNNCVIDDQFSLAITEQKTVGEALNEGYLHKDWRFKGLNENVAYNEAYSYRSILILKKYRIVPAGWEEAIYRVSDSKNQSATLQDLVSCFSPDDEYNTFSQGFKPKGWCRGLIDPKWVLKLPSHYCAKEGYGHIIQKEVTYGQGVEDKDDYIASDIFVTRSDEYCADEQSCIKENSNGTCEVYGYCNEEKRTWNFNQDSCDPVFNTCETFKNVDNGKSISYLKNTLDYSGCTSDSAGCSFYSYNGPYNVDNDKVTWKSYNDIYLNNNAESCAESDEGCSQMIRVQAAYGHNFIKNGGFEEIDFDFNSWTSCSSPACLVDDSYSGDQALEVNNESLSVEVGPQTYNISGKTYTFSFYAKDCTSGDDFGFVGGKYNVLDDSEEWQYYRLSNTYFANQTLGNTVGLEINSNTCLIDDVKLELGNIGTKYSDYGDNNVIYQKMLPEYLWSDCYENPDSGNLDFSLKEDAPDVCSDSFSRLCNADEAGCNIYTNVKDREDQVVAQVSTQDYCPGECNNYDLYIGAKDYFNSTQGAKFIPETANTCSAADIGCIEFTNLDVLNSGGEAKEYYTSLKQCIKPSENDCTAFYVWQGSNDGSYQLESYTLEKAEYTNEPAVVENDTSLCNEDIYNLPITDPNYNSDCYQFYNTEGEVSYHLYSKTITCSEDCHPYRMSKRNIDSNINTASVCNSLGDSSYWENNTNSCYYCENGGTWSQEYDSCVYQAIPGQGESCSQEANGCREYNGNSGNNIRIVKTFDFANSLQGWEGRCGDAAELSTVALGRNDQSLWYKQGGGSESCSQEDNNEPRAEVVLGSYNLNSGSAYSLKFMAKVDTATDLNIYFENDNSQKSYFEITGAEDSSSVTLQGDSAWHQYELSLSSLDHILSGNEALVVESDTSFYLDNIILREIVDKYYLIEDSWETPNSCYYDTLNEYKGVDYNLGCSEYSNNLDQFVFLRSFSSLCQESAIGCQLMVDTYDTKDYKKSVYNDDNDNGACDENENDCVSINADEYVFAVYNANNTCSSDFKSCQRLGKSVNYGDQVLFSDVYLKNDPDKYSTILCSEDTANCEAWVSGAGERFYFKNPSDKICEWKEGDEGEWNWYKKSINKCDENSNGIAEEYENVCVSSDDCLIPSQLMDGENSCLSDDDCPDSNSCNDGYCVYECVEQEENFPCPVDSNKTIGFGGGGNQVNQPTDDWVGICEKNASTCSEYIDPVSDYAINSLSNPRFLDLNEDGSYGDEWNIENNNAYQSVYLVANRAYVFAVNNLNVDSVEPYIECDSKINVLDSDNEFFEANENRINLDSSIDNRYRIIVSSTDQFCRLHRDTDEYLENEPELIFKEAIIDYQLSKNLDTDSCNGKVDIEKGCVLFNERSQNTSAGLSSLIYNAYDSYISDSKSPQSVNNGENSLNANTLIKVDPNRVCNTWLACRTKVVDENGDITCYDVGDCDALDKDGECANFLPNSNAINTFDTVRDKNSSGYSVLNKYNVSNMSESGSTPQSSSFDFEGGDASNVWSDDAGDGNIAIIVDEPAPSDSDKQFNASYPAEGKAFLKSKADREVKSPIIDIQRNQQYYINYLLNTNNLTFGTEAEVSIIGVISENEDGVGEEGDVIVSWQDKSSVWERKVHDFIVTRYDKIKIQISSDEVDDSKYVYVDDINIEPVLKVGGNSEDKFVSKTCRLYPKQDSLSCISTNENVIANGWQGYCLQKDPYHPDICLMWYPVDSISTFTNKDSGYQGKTPLYYCSQADGNFVLTEKRKPFLLESIGNMCVDKDMLYGDCQLTVRKVPDDWYECDNPWGCPRVYLSDELREHYVEYRFYLDESWDGCTFYHGKNKARAYSYAIPKGVGQVKIKARGDWRTYDIPDSDSFYNTTVYQSGDAKTYTFEPTTDNNGCVGEYNIYHDIKFVNGESWYPYNGLKEREDERIDDSIPYGGGTISDDRDPILKIYDYETDKFVSYEKYNVRCKTLEKVVSDDGSNKAWSVRSSSDSGEDSTPDFLNTYYSPMSMWLIDGLNQYNFNREDQPFGSSYLSDNAFADEIVFKSRDNKDDFDSYAGLPYGCEADTPPGNIGCISLGFCEDQQHLTCLLPSGNENDEIKNKMNVKQCGNNDKCIPYVKKRYGGFAAPLPDDGDKILKNIFLKSYSSHKYDAINDAWVPDGPYDYSPTGEEDTIPFCGEERAEAEFCYIFPQIKNIGLYKAGQEMDFNESSSSFIIYEPGNYDLKFNSIIDKEQLPLYEIVIDWGDDSVQTITDQDYRPNEEQPHIVSHIYTGIEGETEREIKILIKDNWGFTRCCRNDDDCSYMQERIPPQCPVRN
ncbi:MAG TPA: hypothetical protein VJ926_03065 [Patescibacteria group bacterium]|nr:hypothetical protein [Patescibacteria group bacterium]